MNEFFLMGHDHKVYFSLPKTWTVLNNAVLNTEAAKRSVYDMTDESLNNPVKSPRLEEIIHPGDSIALIVDDPTRPTPKKDILNCLWDHLRRCDVRPEQVDIVFALGTHRPPTEKEQEDLLGKTFKESFRITCHDAHADDLVSMGTLAHAGELKINPVVAKADIRIGIGSILPHPMNGFGGGAKILLPGVSNVEAIQDHHNALMVAKGASFGQIEGNPFRDEICTAARLARLDFIINAVYNANEEVKGIVTGDPEEAHANGAEWSLEEYAVNVDGPADVTVTSAFPHLEGSQMLKPLGPATMITKPGGFVILFSSKIHGGGFPEPLLDAFDTAFGLSDGDTRSLVMQHLARRELIMPNAPMDFNCALNLTLLYLSRVKIILVCPDADKDQAARMGFDYADSLGEAFSMIGKKVPDATVNILPSGGLVVPLVKEPLSWAP